MRTLECRLYPTPLQEAEMLSWMRSACRVYNCALELRKWEWQARRVQLSFYDLCVQLTDLRKDPEYGRVPANIHRDALRKLDRSYRYFFKHIKSNKKVGFPRFKSSIRWKSFEILATGKYVKNGKIHIPKLGLISCRNLRHNGSAKAIRVVIRAGKWYAQLVVDGAAAIPAPRKIVSKVGIDVGLTYFATLSNGETINNPRFYKKAKKELAKRQKVLSRRKRGSNRRKIALLKLQRQHERVRCLRHQFLHHVSNQIIKKYDLIAVEDLDIKKLSTGRFSSSIHDAGWGAFIGMLMYKAANAGATVVKVHPAFTSQDCSRCGRRVEKPLSERMHTCLSCGLTIGRDHNAAINILLAAGGAATDRGGLPVGGLVKREVLKKTPPKASVCQTDKKTTYLRTHG